MFDFLLTNHCFFNIYMVFLVYYLLVAPIFICIRHHIFRSGGANYLFEKEKQEKDIINDISSLLYIMAFIQILGMSRIPEEFYSNYSNNCYSPRVFLPFYVVFIICLINISISKIENTKNKPNTYFKIRIFLLLFCIALPIYLLMQIFRLNPLF